MSEQLKKRWAMEIGEILESIIAANSETPELQLRTWLDRLYLESSRQGLSSSQLKLLIHFICESNLLSISTKFYIVENCLIPNEFISLEVIQEVIRNLGTANALLAYKLQVPSNLQTALCKWLVHVFFLVLPSDKHSNCSSIWIHLWQYDFLQRWLTYIIVWSTTSVRDVKPWKIDILERISSKSGYTDGQACATLILRKYSSLLGSSKTIPSVISRIKCNARRLRTLQQPKLDNIFLGKLRRVLTNNLNFTKEMVDELISSHLDQLNFEENPNITSRYRPRDPNDKISILEMRSLHQLAWNWDILLASKDVEQIVNNPISWFSLFRLATNDPVWKILEDWLIIQLRKLFQKHTKNLRIAKTIVRICQVHPILATKIYNEFLAYHYLHDNPILFLYIYRNLIPLLILNPNHVKRLHKDVLQLLAFCHLEKNSKIDENWIPQICTSILLSILNWFHEDIQELVPLGLEFLHDFRILLIANLEYAFENRFTTTSIILALKIFPNNKNQGDSQLKRIVFPFSLMNKLITYDDPLLLDACCEYLIIMKGFLIDKNVSNKYVQGQNLHIMDLTNYLWRNKILSSKRFLDMPSDFVKNVVDNLFLPNVKDRERFPFSISGVPALSFIFDAKLGEFENKLHPNIHLRHLINEEDFRKSIRGVDKSEGHSVSNIQTLEDLKIEILKHISKDNSFQHISQFLFTFLKSLSHCISH